MEPQVFPLFATPAMIARHPTAETLNPLLSALFLQWEQEGDKHRSHVKRDTQTGIFESHFGLHLQRDPAVAELFRFVYQTLVAFVRGMNRYTPEDLQRIEFDMHSWFHITRRGGYQRAHNHPNASWSAIYCVDPGDPADDGQARSGVVRFLDTRTGADMYRDPANVQMRDPYTMGPWDLRHRAGQMVVFPSYLLHEIAPYEGERPRIVVALNLWASLRNT